MPIGTFLHFFIEGVQPLWEDPACKQGGRWVLKLPKTHTAKYWEELLLGMIGEQFDLVPTGEVLGLVLSLKYHNDQISLWHRNGSDSACVAKIRDCIEKILGNSAFKGSSAYHKKTTKGVDLASCVEAGQITITHESFTELIKQDEMAKHEPKTFERGGYRGRGRGGFSRNVDNREETKSDDDGFQTVTAPKK